MKKKSIYQIAHRANINVKHTSLNDVVLYEDHRSIINVIFKLIEIRKIEDSLDIILFDDHDDYCHPKENALKSIKKFLKKPNEQELSRIVEFELNPLDDDWIKVGMELGLINNVFLFNSTESGIGLREGYKTTSFGTKYLYNIGNVWDVLGYHGRLNDPIKTEYQQLCNDLGWIFENHVYSFRDDRRKFILDIDLDFLSTRILDKTISYPKEVIVPKLAQRFTSHYHHYYNSIEFIQDLIKRSEVATICFENGCCGGYLNSFNNLSLVDELLFGNQLLKQDL